MNTQVNITPEKCCSACWHSFDKPCPHLLQCWNEGPVCHKEATCQKEFASRISRLRREDVVQPVIFIGAGTCGLGAGAAKTMAVVREYLRSHEIEADIVEVGCIGLCSAEPLLDVQLPGRNRISFKGVTADKTERVLPVCYTHLTLPTIYSV